MNGTLKDSVQWIIIFIILSILINQIINAFFYNTQNNLTPISYSKFITDVQHQKIKFVIISPEKISGLYHSDEEFFTYSSNNDPHLMNDLLLNDIEIKNAKPKERSLLLDIFISWFPILLLVVVWIFFMRQMQNGPGKGAIGFGKSKAKLLKEDQIKVTFADVAGVEEAKEEVEEVVDFLKDPAKYQKLGGKIPHGLLMIGPSGTGKTLLARAIAGEAKVPYFSTCGSEMVEMFVGIGASRVRDMFEQGKKHAPCIIFIDEIDAVGRQRGAGLGGGHDEREQTLNQLLVEMDGFESSEGIIVIAATNRPDVLDKALLRPGRFDRQVVVGMPDIKGREHILKVHLTNVPLSDDVNPKIIAQGTTGFSGAELANLVNEAALGAARNNKTVVTMSRLEMARDRLIMGIEKKSIVMSEKEKEMTAYHEAGHAIVGRLVPDHDPVYKVSIMPRGQALGVTMFLPETDQHSASKQKMDSIISSLYGGRIAEEMIYGWEYVTTGAQNDIERATNIADKMVTKWGLSKLLGPLVYSEESGSQAFNEERTPGRKTDGDMAILIHQEIRRISDTNYNRAEKILKDNIDILHSMSKALIKYETIDTYQLDDLMNRVSVREPMGWNE